VTQPSQSPKTVVVLFVYLLYCISRPESVIRNAANGLGGCGEGTSSCPGLFPGIHVLAKVERRHGRDKPGHDEKEKSESLFQVVQERLKISAAFSVILGGR
jgi:hypothetical protein